MLYSFIYLLSQEGQFVVFISKLSNVASLTRSSTEQTNSSSSVVPEENLHMSRDIEENFPPGTPQMEEEEAGRDFAGPMGNQPEFTMSKSGYELASSSDVHAKDFTSGDTSQLLQEGTYVGIQLLLIHVWFIMKLVH